MAKKKMSKKTKYTLLGIGLVAVGAGYFIAKALKKESNLAGIGALRYTDLGEPIRDYKGYTIIKKDRLGKSYYVVFDEGVIISKHWTLKDAKKKIDWLVGPSDPKSRWSQKDNSVDNWLQSVKHYY